MGLVVHWVYKYISGEPTRRLLLYHPEVFSALLPPTLALFQGAMARG